MGEPTTLILLHILQPVQQFPLFCMFDSQRCGEMVDGLRNLIQLMGACMRNWRGVVAGLDARYAGQDAG